ncbi:PIG-L family deacetylase [Microvirga sp. 2TAF3]|uniref:PIG-L family deacetylase n=1 Tax=Microvirga sp. 2TAF3 TaxID=3233014 RepID=UPI003F9B4DAE
MLRHHERIAREIADPALVRLHRKLERLSSVLTVMNTGAHPDDEANGMLAALRFGLGMRVIVACSTRGEGGQNAVGPERGAALGVLRTREMEVAAKILDADVVWLGHGPEDPVHDFGFSKNGDDTLARWGEDRIVERLVRAYRQERPDIVIPTFLDVPGQHGHHQAMTRAARIAVERAADPHAYPQHLAEGLKPWRVAKFYLPAWSGGGATYDDEVPPPEPTLVIRASGDDLATGTPFARIGEWSRAAHLSQGMGIWLDNPKRVWPLHLLTKANGPAKHEDDILDGLDATIGALASSEGLSPKASDLLISAQHDIKRAQSAFPDPQSILDAALAAARAISGALAECSGAVRDAIEHRLTHKLRELDAVILEVRGVQVRAWTEPAVAAPGERAVLHVTVDNLDGDIAIEPVLSSKISVSGRTISGNLVRFELDVAEDAYFTAPYPPRYSSAGGNGEVAIAVEAEMKGQKIRALVDLEEPLRIAPQHSVSIDPEVFVIGVDNADSTLSAKVSIEGSMAQDLVTFGTAPPGWVVTYDGNHVNIEPPSNCAPGLYRIEPSINELPAYRSTLIAYPHIGRTAYLSREVLSILALDLKRPLEVRIGYVGSGNDRVGLWLARLGFPVTELDTEALRGDLSRFTTIVVGIFAFGRRQDLASATPNLHRFVDKGGHLVTLYHKPSDGWDPATTPPRHIEIGSPSVRWRVTNPNAPVAILDPDHSILAGPNRIGLEDWAGWDKERGIYFASRWDDAYVPLIGISDPGEASLSGGLLSGKIGQGRHTHVSLVLHHQLDKLVPGAFRLLANLVQPA